MATEPIDDRIVALEMKVGELSRQVEQMASLLNQPTSAEIARFQALVDEWKRDRGPSSKIKDLVNHGAYQQIIGMGPRIVPLLLREFEQRPSHWDWALHSITGADPVPPQSTGRIKEMASIWADWGRAHGYQW